MFKTENINPYARQVFEHLGWGVVINETNGELWYAEPVPDVGEYYTLPRLATVEEVNAWYEAGTKIHGRHDMRWLAEAAAILKKRSAE